MGRTRGRRCIRTPQVEITVPTTHYELLAMAFSYDNKKIPMLPMRNRFP